MLCRQKRVSAKQNHSYLAEATSPLVWSSETVWSATEPDFQWRQQHSFCIVFHWSSSSSSKEDVVYCTRLWHNPKESLKRRNQPSDGSQQSSRWSQSASDWQKQPLLCSAGLVRIFGATEGSEGVFGRVVLADVWLMSIRQTNTVILCLRLAWISGTSTKGSKLPYKTV